MKKSIANQKSQDKLLTNLIFLGALLPEIKIGIHLHGNERLFETDVSTLGFNHTLRALNTRNPLSLTMQRFLALLVIPTSRGFIYKMPYTGKKRKDRFSPSQLKLSSLIWLMLETYLSVTTKKHLLLPFLEECREAFRNAAAEEFRFASRYASTLPEIWELHSIGTLLRVKAFANLTCLRDITHERNTFSSSRLFKLFLTIPCDMRQDSRLASRALRQCGKKCAWIPDSNTWLPIHFPASMHKMSSWTRLQIAKFRAKLLARRANDNISGSGSWVHNERLIVINENLRQEIDKMLDDKDCFPPSRYDLTSFRETWTKHKTTFGENTEQFYTLNTFWILEQALKKLW